MYDSIPTHILVLIVILLILIVYLCYKLLVTSDSYTKVIAKVLQLSNEKIQSSSKLLDESNKLVAQATELYQKTPSNENNQHLIEVTSKHNVIMNNYLLSKTLSADADQILTKLNNTELTVGEIPNLVYSISLSNLSQHASTNMLTNLSDSSQITLNKLNDNVSMLTAKANLLSSNYDKCQQDLSDKQRIADNAMASALAASSQADQLSNGKLADLNNKLNKEIAARISAETQLASANNLATELTNANNKAQAAKVLADKANQEAITAKAYVDNMLRLALADKDDAMLTLSASNAKLQQYNDIKNELEGKVASLNNANISLSAKIEALTSEQINVEQRYNTMQEESNHYAQLFKEAQSNSIINGNLYKKAYNDKIAFEQELSKVTSAKASVDSLLEQAINAKQAITSERDEIRQVLVNTNKLLTETTMKANQASAEAAASSLEVKAKASADVKLAYYSRDLAIAERDNTLAKYQRYTSDMTELQAGKDQTITSLTRTNSTYLDQINAQDKKFAELSTVNSQLTSSVGQLTLDNSDLSNVNSRLSSENTRLTNEYSAIYKSRDDALDAKAQADSDKDAAVASMNRAIAAKSVSDQLALTAKAKQLELESALNQANLLKDQASVALDQAIAAKNSALASRQTSIEALDASKIQINNLNQSNNEISRALAYANNARDNALAQAKNAIDELQPSNEARIAAEDAADAANLAKNDAIAAAAQSNELLAVARANVSQLSLTVSSNNEIITSLRTQLANALADNAQLPQLKQSLLDTTEKLNTAQALADTIPDLKKQLADVKYQLANALTSNETIPNLYKQISDLSTANEVANNDITSLQAQYAEISRKLYLANNSSVQVTQLQNQLNIAASDLATALDSNVKLQKRFDDYIASASTAVSTTQLIDSNYMIKFITERTSFDQTLKSACLKAFTLNAPASDINAAYSLVLNNVTLSYNKSQVNVMQNGVNYANSQELDFFTNWLKILDYVYTLDSTTSIMQNMPSQTSMTLTQAQIEAKAGELSSIYTNIITGKNLILSWILTTKEQLAINRSNYTLSLPAYYAVSYDAGTTGMNQWVTSLNNNLTVMRPPEQSVNATIYTSSKNELIRVNDSMYPNYPVHYAVKCRGDSNYTNTIYSSGLNKPLTFKKQYDPVTKASYPTGQAHTVADSYCNKTVYRYGTWIT